MGLISGILGFGTSLIGGAIAGNTIKKGYQAQQDIYNKRMSDILQHRNNLYYQDPTQSAENQAAVTQAKQLLDEQTKQTLGSNIVAGGTDESVALQKQVGANAVGQMLQQQAVQGAAKKEDAWRGADEQINAFSKYIADSKLAQARGKAEGISKATGLLSEGVTKIIQ